MDTYQLTVVDSEGQPEDIEAVALIVFQETNPAQVTLRMFDNPEIPEEWWRMVIKEMYDGLDKAMESRQNRLEKRT